MRTFSAAFGFLAAFALLLLVVVGALPVHSALAQHAEQEERSEDWWDPWADGSPSRFATYTSESYKLITDLPAGYAELILVELERNLELYREVLAGLDVPETFEQRLRVRIFAELADYQAYHREHWGESIGASFAYYHVSDPAGREALGYFVAREPFFAGLRHEGFHQVFRHVVGYPPQWINEGLAEYCEAAQWCDEAQRFEPRLHTGWARQLREFIGEGRRYRFVEAQELVRMSKDEWDAEAASTYAGSWALVWLMRHELEGGRELLERYLTALKAEAPRKANERRGWEETFGSVDAQQFAKLSQAYKRFHAEVVPTAEYALFCEAVTFVLAREYTAAEPLLTRVIEADESFYPAYYYRAVVRRAHERPAESLDDLLHAISVFPQYTAAIRLAIPLAIEQGQLDLAAHLAERLKRVAEHFAPQARHWQNQIATARERRHDNDNDNAPQPRALPRQTGWPPLDEEPLDETDDDTADEAQETATPTPQDSAR